MPKDMGWEGGGRQEEGGKAEATLLPLSTVICTSDSSGLTRPRDLRNYILFLRSCLAIPDLERESRKRESMFKCLVFFRRYEEFCVNYSRFRYLSSFWRKYVVWLRIKIRCLAKNLSSPVVILLLEHETDGVLYSKARWLFNFYFWSSRATIFSLLIHMSNILRAVLRDNNLNFGHYSQILQPFFHT